MFRIALRKTNFVYTTHIFPLFEMPYLFLHYFVILRLNGILQLVCSLAAAVPQLGFRRVASVLQVCWFAFVYIPTSVL